MGKQSARMVYQGKDHKDIYYKENFHDKMYIGKQLVWEKIYEKCFIGITEIDEAFEDFIFILIPEERKLLKTFQYYLVENNVPYGIGKVLNVKSSIQEKMAWVTNNGDMWKDISRGGPLSAFNLLVTNGIFFNSYLINKSGQSFEIRKVNNNFSFLDFNRTDTPLHSTPQRINRCSEEAFIIPGQTFVMDFYKNHYICIIDKEGNITESVIDLTDLKEDYSFLIPNNFTFSLVSMVKKTAYLIAFVKNKNKESEKYDYWNFLVYKSNNYTEWNKFIVPIRKKNNADNSTLYMSYYIICRNDIFYAYDYYEKILFITKDFISFQSKKKEYIEFVCVNSGKKYKLNIFEFIIHSEKINNCTYFNGEKLTQNTDDFIFYNNYVREIDGTVRNGKYVYYVNNLWEPDEEKCFVIDLDNYNLK